MLKNINTQVVLNLSRYNENVVVSANRGDLNSRTIVFSFVDDYGDYILPEGIVAKIKGTRPDGAAIYENCTIDGNNVIYEITPYVLSVSGNVKAKISLETSDASQILSTVAFTIHISKDPYSEDAIIMTDEFSALNELIKKMDEGLEEIRAIKDMANTVSENTQTVLEAKDLVLEKATEVDNNAKQVADDKDIVVTAKDEVSTNTQIVVDAKDVVLGKADEVATNTSSVSDMKSSVEISEQNAKESELNAKDSETSASTSATIATEKSNIAVEKANIATEQATKSEDNALLSKSYAVGTEDIVRENDSTDNSKYYYEQAKNYAEIAQQASGLVVPQFYIDFTTGCLMSDTAAQGMEFEIIDGDFIGRMVTS